MSEEFQGYDGGSGFKVFGCLGTIAAVLLVLIYALLVWPSIEDSQARQARAEAAAEESKAYARAAEVRAEVDKVAIRADTELAKLVEQHDHELEMLRQHDRDFQERVVLLTIAIKNLDRQEYNRLAAQLDANEAQHTPAWWLAVAVAAAGLVFVVLLLIWRAVAGWKGWIYD